MSLTAEQIKNNLVNQILQNFPTADVETGSVLRDVMVDPQAVQIAALSEELDYINYLNTFIQNADKISEEDLDEIGASYGVDRHYGNQATGLITFQSKTLPSEDIRIGADDGSGGVTVKTLMTEGGNSYVFTTTQTVWLKSNATFNEDHQCYEVTAPIVASIAGSEYNLGIGTIRVLVDAISSITGVYNYIPTVGGTDIQDNVSYAESIKNAILGGSKNIESGIDNVLLNIEHVTEVKTLHPNSDEEPTPAGTSISYIRGSQETIVTDYPITYDGINFSYNLPKKPVTRIISVSAEVGGERKDLVQGIDYDLISNKKGYELNNTMYAYNQIIFYKTEYGTPNVGSDAYITYAYNSLIETCQNELQEQMQDYLILGNVYVAQATPVILQLGTNIKLKYNYNTEEVKNDILSGLSEYILSFKLGADITQEQIYTYLTTTYPDYISGIFYPFLTFCTNENLVSSSSIKVNYGQYISLDENSLNIVFE